MCIFGRFTTVQQFDVSVKICFPLLSVEDLLYPCGSGKRLVTQTERAIPRAGKGSAVDERIILNGKRFRLPQVAYIVKVLFILTEDPFAAVKAQLGEAAGSHEFIFIAAIDVSPSLGRWFTIGTDSGQPLTSCKKEEGYDEPIEV